jgi:tetratricopeptide (TPR) repeat protein
VKGDAATGTTPAFGDEAGRVLARARTAARRLRHSRLGTEHLLLGMLEDPRTLAGAILYQADVRSAEVRRAVELVSPPGEAEPETEFVMDPALRRALRLAPDEARRLGDDTVRAEHLLLAALRDPSCHAAVVLRAMGVNLEALRLAIAREHPGGAEVRASAGWMARGPYRALAWLGGACLLAALAVAVWWVVATPARRWQDYAYLLLIPLALLGMALAFLGSSRMEAQRGAASVEALVEAWRSRRAPAQIAAALRLAESGRPSDAEHLLLLAVARPMPEPEYRAALPVIAQWLLRDRWAPLALRARAELHFRDERLEPALADLTQAIQREPDHGEWHHLLGTVLARAGHPEQALDAFQAACRLQPDVGAFWADLSAALLARAHLSEAQAALPRALALAPDSASAHVTQAAVAYLLDQLDDADAAVTRALQLDPDSATAHAIEAAALLRREQPEQALATARTAAVNATDPPPVLAALEGWALEALDRHQEARAAFADARARAPDLLPLCERLAEALESAGHTASASYHRRLAIALAG